MSLKGYDFLNEDETIIQASFYFKDLTLYVWKNISNVRLIEIIEYIQNEKHEKILHIKLCYDKGDDNV